ncbi:MAG: helix-turn-helix domain-containing protein [Marinosulfonomonas sp.]
MEKMLVSIAEAGQMLGLGRSKIYEMINGGQLVTMHIGRRRLVKIDSIKALVEQSEEAVDA